MKDGVVRTWSRRQFLARSVMFCGGLLAWPAASANSEKAVYGVSLSPVGTVYFSSAPRKVVVYDANYVDMLVALNLGDRIVAAGFPGEFETLYIPNFYRQLPGVTFRASGIQPLYSAGSGLDKEVLYSLNADIHHIDPVHLKNFSHWTDKDIDEIERNVAPFFANRFSRAHNYGGREDYQYYTLWELFRKIAAVYGLERRAIELEQIGIQLEQRARDLRAESSLRVALVNFDSTRKTFGLYSVNGEGFSKAHLRPFGLTDALEKDFGERAYGRGGGTIDLEGMAYANPDVILVHWAIRDDDPQVAAIRGLKRDALGSRINAIADGQVYAAGSPLQGPLMFLFQLEMIAKKLFPESFGQWREHGRLKQEEHLFNRAEVAAVIKGAHL